MPYIIQSLVGTRRDPNRRGRSRGAGQVVPNPHKLKIGQRAIKQGKKISVSDRIFASNEEKITALAKAGIISVRKVGPSTDWKPQEILPEAKKAPVKAEQPAPEPVIEEPVAAEEPVVEAAVAEEPVVEEPVVAQEVVTEEDPAVEAPAPEVAEAPVKRARRKRRANKKAD